MDFGFFLGHLEFPIYIVFAYYITLLVAVYTKNLTGLGTYSLLSWRKRVSKEMR